MLLGNGLVEAVIVPAAGRVMQSADGQRHIARAYGLLVDLMNTNGAVGQPTKFRVRQTADGWKLVLMADGMPVTEAPQR